MLRLPRPPVSFRSVRTLALAAALAVPAVFVPGAHGQDAATPPPAPAPGAMPPAAPAAGDQPAPAPVAPAAPAAGDQPTTAPAAAAPQPGQPARERAAQGQRPRASGTMPKVARYDIAAAEGQRILGQNPDPALLLSMFEATATLHHDDLDASLLRWQGVDPMRDVTTQLIDVLAKGHDGPPGRPQVHRAATSSCWPPTTAATTWPSNGCATAASWPCRS